MTFLYLYIFHHITQCLHMSWTELNNNKLIPFDGHNSGHHLEWGIHEKINILLSSRDVKSYSQPWKKTDLMIV